MQIKFAGIGVAGQVKTLRFNLVNPAQPVN